MKTTILVFKTNVKEADVPRLAPALNAHPAIDRWNVDCQDVDCVLRVVTNGSLPAPDIETLVRRAGYLCEELPG